MNESAVLECQGLARSFVQGPVTIEVLQDVSLAVRAGEAAAIVGASGSGKSTLLHLLAGLDDPTRGSVRVAGEDIHALSESARGRLRNRAIGFVYQMHHLLPEFNAEENVALPLLVARERPAVARSRARELLDAVGLGDRLDHRPAQLSGGERQRVALARAMVTKPALVLADEPTGNLDPATAGQVFAELLRLRSLVGTALVVVTHDLALAARMDRVLRLERGRLV